MWSWYGVAESIIQAEDNCSGESSAEQPMDGCLESNHNGEDEEPPRLTEGAIMTCDRDGMQTEESGPSDSMQTFLMQTGVSTSQACDRDEMQTEEPGPSDSMETRVYKSKLNGSDILGEAPTSR